MSFENLSPDDEQYFPDGLISDEVSVWSLDTFNLTLPSGSFLLHSDELKAKTVIETEWDEETGEIYTERKKTKAQSVTGVSGTKYVMVKDRRTGEHTLRLEITSKSLKSSYLLGICLDTFPALVEALRKDKVASFSPSDLLLSYVTDLDYQRLFIWEESPQMLCDYYSHLSSCYEPVKLRGRHFRVFTQPEKGNIGFDLNERRHTKHIASCHLKSYYKGGELLAKGQDILEHIFPDTFPELLMCPSSIVSKLHRQELTISGRDQAKALGLSGTTLEELLRMPQETITGALCKVMEANFMAKHMRPKKSSEALSTGEELIANFLVYLLPQVGYLEALDIATKSFPYSSRDRKSKAKAQVRKIAELLISQGVKPKPLSEHSPNPMKEIEGIDFLQRLFGR